MPSRGDTKDLQIHLATVGDARKGKEAEMG